MCIIDNYLTEAESTSYQNKSFKSDILDPNKIFKDIKNSYIEIHYPGIEEREDLQKFILSLSKKACLLIDKKIDSMYDNWYDEDDHITKNQVKLMARNLFDVISLKESNKKDKYWVEIWINSSERHKDSDNFFGCHCMTVTYEIDPKTCKILKTFDVDFGG